MVERLIGRWPIGGGAGARIDSPAAPESHSMRQRFIPCANESLRAPQVHSVRRRFVPCAYELLRAPEVHSVRRRIYGAPKSRPNRLINQKNRRSG
jgi:hypothetical protein